MNAYELAKMLFHFWNETEGVEISPSLLDDAATMLRQQADKLKKYELRNQEQIKRIAELEKEIKVSYGWNTALTKQLSAQIESKVRGDK